MVRVVITAQVEDSAKWEESFRTYGAKFRDYTATAIDFTASDENEIAILWEVDDASKFLALVDTPATADAMEFDSVKRDTVKIHVLDKTFDL